MGCVFRQLWSFREKKRLRVVGIPSPGNRVCLHWGVWTAGTALAVRKMRVRFQEESNPSSCKI